jgi:hypothetical protein
LNTHQLAAALLERAPEAIEASVDTGDEEHPYRRVFASGLYGIQWEASGSVTLLFETGESNGE